MTNWIYDSTGNATMIFENDYIRNNHGQVIAWINSINVYNLIGNHVGWFEKGVLYGSNNEVLGFIRN